MDQVGKRDLSCRDQEGNIVMYYVLVVRVSSLRTLCCFSFARSSICSFSHCKFISLLHVEVTCAVGNGHNLSCCLSVKIDISWLWQWCFEDLTHCTSVSSLSSFTQNQRRSFCIPNFQLNAVEEDVHEKRGREIRLSELSAQCPELYPNETKQHRGLAGTP